MELEALIDRLAAFEPAGTPFVSVYLDARPDNTGRDHYDALARAELFARTQTYPLRSPERQSLDRDAARILAYLETTARPAASGLAIFACDGAQLFEAIQLPVPIEESQVIVGDRPHLYPLAAVGDRYRRHAAVLLDSHTARIVVFALGRVVARQALENAPGLKRTDAGGWSQARYQRHVEAHQLQHVKETVAALERIVRDEQVERIVIAGNDAVIPGLRDQLSKHLREMVADVLHLDIRTPEDEILRASLEAVRQQDARDDAERVRRMLDAYRAGGLATVGVAGTLAALANGQVHELLIGGDPAALRAPDGRSGAEVANELIARARQTDARVVVIENSALLGEVGGVGALLRYRIRKAA